MTPDDSAGIFEEHRPLLFGLAYRMLGTVMDAQDAVQDTFLRWQRASHEAIASPRAWLTTALTRLCINHLKLARVQRETYFGAWLPAPLVTGERAGDDDARFADSLSLAFLVLLESPTPVERAVFILREVLGYDFGEIARVVDKSEANCRQILVRARRHVGERRARFKVSPEEAEVRMLDFIRMVRAGAIEELVSHLTDDVVLLSDGGGKARALSRPIRGADPVARLLVGAARKFGHPDEEVLPALVNGLPGFVAFHRGEATRVLACVLVEGRIGEIFVMTNPDKLRHLHRAC